MSTAQRDIRIQLRHPAGQERLTIPAESTVGAFIQLVAEKTGMPVARMQLSRGYPPSALVVPTESIAASVSEYFCNGDSVLVSDNPTYPTLRATAAPHTSRKRAQETHSATNNVKRPRNFGGTHFGGTHHHTKEASFGGTHFGGTHFGGTPFGGTHFGTHHYIPEEELWRRSFGNDFTSERSEAPQAASSGASTAQEYQECKTADHDVSQSGEGDKDIAWDRFERRAKSDAFVITVHEVPFVSQTTLCQQYATYAERRDAFRKLAKRWHPDKFFQRFGGIMASAQVDDILTRVNESFQAVYAVCR